MPVVNFHIVWPDQRKVACYSPSRAIQEHLEAGREYALEDFMKRMRDGLNLASERVRAKYGYACSAALDQMEIIEQEAKRFSDMPQATVKVEKFS